MNIGQTLTIVAIAREMPENKLLNLKELDIDRYKEKSIKPATKVSFNP